MGYIAFVKMYVLEWMRHCRINNGRNLKLIWGLLRIRTNIIHIIMISIVIIIIIITFHYYDYHYY